VAELERRGTTDRPTEREVTHRRGAGTRRRHRLTRRASQGWLRSAPSECSRSSLRPEPRQ
jgi:hypothetical protein